MNEWMSFAAWLKQKRESKKYSQYRLADASGIARAYIGRMETEGAVALPTLETRRKLHKVFGTSDQALVDDGVAEWVTYMDAQGVELAELVAKTEPIAADIGERAAIVEMLDRLPDDSVQHLRRFLEAVVKT